MAFVQFESRSQSKDSVLKSLDKHVIPISLNPEFIGGEHLPAGLVDRASIIGLGEATHGTHEFFEIKARLLQHLVEYSGVRVLITESFFTNNELNSYVLHAVGNPYRAIFNMGYGFFYTEEMLALVEWVRLYNDRQPEDMKVRMYGCDIPVPKFITPPLYDFLATNNRLTATAEGTFQMLNKKTVQGKFTRKEQESTRELLTKLDLLLAAKQGRETQWIGHHKRLLEQYLEMRVNPTKGLRDEYMAENVLWIRAYENDAKVMLWAHNGHISKDEKGILSKPMGWYLKNELDGDYYAMGLGFGGGEFYAANLTKMKAEPVSAGEALVGSLDALFSEIGAEQFFLDMAIVGAEPDLKSLLGHSGLTKNIGESFNPDKADGYYRKIALSDNYDGYMFIRSTSPTKILSYDYLK
tara:strand:- start:17591 stop:18820 length:1230 start_codon:yes stop_codon:yes gene_type:complete